MTTYDWAPDNSRMRAVSLVPWGASGAFLPLWPKGSKVWSWTGTTLASAALNLASSCGFAGAASDGAGNAWAVQYAGSLISYSSGGVASGYTMPAGKVFTGCAYVPTYAAPYIAAVDGSIYEGVSGVAVGLNGFGQNSTGLATSGTTLFSLGSGVVNVFQLTDIANGAPRTIVYPMNTALCLAASTAASAVAVGGWSPAVLTSAYTDIKFSPVAPVMVGLTGGNKIDLYLGVGEVWGLTASYAVTGNPTTAAWKPDGTGLLISDPVAGLLQVYDYSLGALAFSQALNMPGAGSIAIASDNAKALVCRPAANAVVPLALSGSVWASGSPITLPTPQSVATSGATTAVVGCGSGVVNLLYTGGLWVPSAVATVGYNPSSVIYSSGNVLAAGSLGSSGYFSAVSGSTVLFNYGWAGSVGGMIYDQGQVTIADPVDDILWCFDNLFTEYQFVFNVVPAQNFSNLAVSPYTPSSSGGTIFGMGSGSTSLYQYTTPNNLEPIRNGVVGILNFSGWSVATLGSGHVPTALTFDASGNVYAVTLQNDLYEISSAGVVLSSSVVTQFSGQTQTTPLGISAMAFVGSGLYGASSLAGPLVKLV